MKLPPILFVLTLACLCCVSPSEAVTIGISHVGPGDGQWGSDGTASPVTLPAGVVLQSNWNNIEDATGLLNDLMDSAGNPTTADVEWSSALGTWDTGGAMASGDEQLMHGYLDADNRGATLTISDLPPEITARGYDLYIYHESQGGDGRVGYYHIESNPSALTTIWANDMAGTFGEGGVGFVEDGYGTQALAEAGDGGNYVVFRNMISDGFTLEAMGITGTPRMPIQGVQIVPIPEPSTLVLAGIGLLVLAISGWRRRRA